MAGRLAARTDCLKAQGQASLLSQKLPVDMWITIGQSRTLRLRLPRKKERGKHGNARLRPHTHRHNNNNKEEL
jgi:hypothetical protein